MDKICDISNFRALLECKFSSYVEEKIDKVVKHIAKEYTTNYLPP